MRIGAATEARGKAEAGRRKTEAGGKKTHTAMKGEGMSIQGRMENGSGRRLLRRSAAALLGAALIAGCQGEDSARDQYRLEGIEKMDQGDYEGAIASFEEAIAHSDGRVGEFEVDVLKYRGEAEYKAEDYPAAAHTYDVLLQVDGEEPDYYYLRSMAYSAQGMTAEAEADAQAAAGLEQERGEVSPVMDEAMTALGGAWLGAGDEEKAQTAFDRVLTAGAATAGTYNALGLACLDGGQAELAADYFEQGLALPQSGSEEYGLLLRNRAAALEHSGDFAGALELFQQYTASYGTDEAIEREIRFLETR